MKIKPVNPVVKTLAYNPKHGGQHTPYEFKNKTNQKRNNQCKSDFFHCNYAFYEW